MNNTLPIALTMGEPASIASEITCKAWLNIRQTKNPPTFFAITNPSEIEKASTSIGEKINYSIIKEPQQANSLFKDSLPIIPLPENITNSNNLPRTENAHLVIKAIEIATNLSLNKKSAAIVTNPIHKETLIKSGFQFQGHTEYLAHLCGLNSEHAIMMLANEKLKTIPLTIHQPIQNIHKYITQNKIINSATIINKSLQKYFNIKNPKIFVCGLNPHAGENGTIGNQEITTINPAIKILQQQGMKISGSFSADSMFHEQARKLYDAALCMYHDQALIPIKTLDFYNSINITLGLPIIRTSPDHGTACDITGKNIANPQSLIQAIKTAHSMAKNHE